MNFPPPFRSLHSLPFIAFHYLPSPFITFHHPFCFTHPSFTHHCLRLFVLLPFFYSLCFTPSIVLHSFALLSPIVLRPLFYFLPLCFTLSHCLPPLRGIYSHCFAPVFYSLATSANPSPTPQKATFFSFFKEIL